MFIKDPSRFRIRNALSTDCVQLYQLVRQCYQEIVDINHLDFQKSNKSNAIKSHYDVNKNEMNENNLLDKNTQNKDENYKNFWEKNLAKNKPIFSQSFEEFVDCLGHGKNEERDKIFDCLLIEDLNEQKIIAIVTYSYGYFTYAGKEIHMNHFYVRPEKRFNGFGRLLMKNLIRLAANDNLHKIKYDVPKTLTGFCKFMEKLGASDFTNDTDYNLFKMDLRTIEKKLAI